MSNGESNQYEVERILEARVEKKRKQLLLKFCVRWKGYGPDDDTWEPVESFDGSEEIIERFWERVNSGGRDFRDTSKFRAGEVFMQTGPPRRKRKRDSGVSVTVSPTAQDDSFKVTQSEEHVGPDNDPHKRPKKRGREKDTRPGGAISSPVRAPNKRGTDETGHKTKAISSPPARRRRVNRRLVASPDTVSASDENDDSTMLGEGLFGSPIEPTKELPDDSPSPLSKTSSLEKSTIPSLSPLRLPTVKKPLHRSAKPLIKLVDDPQMAAMEGAITVKARLIGQKTSTANTNEPRAQIPSRPKPGPGRSSIGVKKNTSSLLTFEKGALKTVKGKYAKDETRRSESVGDDPLPAESQSLGLEPPNASELLGLAGFDPQMSEPLPSYESVAPAEQGISSEHASEFLPRGDKTIHSDNLLPASSSVVPQTISSASWKYSTIFDPLIRGADPEDAKTFLSEVPGSVPFRLNLDHSFSITIHLSNPSIPPTDSTATFRTITRPGAFYKGNYALDICKTIHSVGSPGFVTMAPDAKEEDKKHFQRFFSRLCDGELFIVPAGIEVLAFWSAENVTLAQKLNMQLGQDVQENLLFSKIIVDNYSEYSELVTYADPVPWLQYMEKHQ